MLAIGIESLLRSEKRQGYIDYASSHISMRNSYLPKLTLSNDKYVDEVILKMTVALKISQAGSSTFKYKGANWVFGAVH